MDQLEPENVNVDSITALRYGTYIDVNTGQRIKGAGGGFVTIARTNNGGREPTEAQVRRVVYADQLRRQNGVLAALIATGYIKK